MSRYVEFGMIANLGTWGRRTGSKGPKGCVFRYIYPTLILPLKQNLSNRNQQDFSGEINAEDCHARWSTVFVKLHQEKKSKR